jgi:trigger factor
MDPNQFAQAVDQQGQIPAIVAEVTRRKALAAVLESVTITDASGNPVDLDALVPGAGEELTAEDVDDEELADDEDVVDAEIVEAEASSDATEDTAAESDTEKA